MLTLYTSSGAIPLNVDNYYIKQLASGYDELCFEISIWDSAYPQIQEEASVYEHSDATDAAYYLVKAIDAGAETAKIKCQIDVDVWKASLTVNYKSASLSVAAIIRSVAPAGWTVSDESGLSYLRTIELTSATPLDVLEQCRDTFAGVTYRFDNVNKVLTVINMTSGQNLGAFVTRDLNLKENNYKGKSAGFATRLYAYGKDWLSFADINSGKPYVDNNTYSSRVICAFWKDERYTVKANLLAAAQEKLAEMAVPQRSFECDVVDLAATDPAKYSELDFQLFSRCILIDQTRSGTQITHIIVERWIYPYLPQKNRVILSTVAPRLQSQVSQIINSLSSQNSIYQQQQSSSQQNAIENATAQITGAKGGNMRAIYDADGNWTELVVMNTDSILTATKLWRFNLGGFGYSPEGYNGRYTTAITMDGAIVADFITTGTLDASRAAVTNLNASNISTGTLSADRIAAHSLGVGKITGSLTGAGYSGDSQSWGINFQTGALTIGNVTAANITAGTLSADRIAANSITVAKLTGSIKAKGYTGDTDSWELNLTDGTLTIGNVTAANITAGTLSSDRIAANSITVSKLTGSIKAKGYTGDSDSWELNLTNGTLTIGNITANNIKTGTIDASVITVSNLNAGNITSGTLSADRIAAHSLGVGKITGSITGAGYTGDTQSWGINFETGTLTIGNITASNIKTGTLDASTVTVSNLNASNITAGTLNVDRINANSITGGKIALGTLTGGVDEYGNATGNLDTRTIVGSNVALGTLTGGVDEYGSANGNIALATIKGGSTGNLMSSTISTDNTVSGINTNLGYAANYGSATAYQGASGPTYFNVGGTLTVGYAIVMGGAGFTPKWSSVLNAYYLGSGGEG